MLYQPPKVTYCGLTIIMSNPSRFDIDSQQLLSANGGQCLTDEIMRPLHINRWMCEVRLTDDHRPLLPGTKCVLCLGTKAMKDWMGQEVIDNTLNEFRGSPLELANITYIASYLPQDAVDKQNYEARLNPNLMDYAEMVIKEREETSPIAYKKRKAMTMRSNYKFWLKQDVSKLVRILRDFGGHIPKQTEASYTIYPRIEDSIELLRSKKDAFLYFDMETIIEPPFNMTCFAFGYDLNNIHIVPIVLPNYTLAYDKILLCRLLQALSQSIKFNSLVAHNGALFDFFVLAFCYGIPIGYNTYDTLIAHHRCFPEVEKSLGHCISLCTYELYHKDEASFAFGNREQAEKLWRYCGKDVSGMMRVHQWQQEYAATRLGLRASIDQAMASIRPYLICTLTGIQYREDEVVTIMAENDRLMMQYLRILRLMAGEEAWLQLKRRSKKALPTSNAQCVSYFHDMLGYPVIARSKKTHKPSLDEKALLKLRLRHNNPAIDVCLRYRQVAKQTGMLKFLPWIVKRNDTNHAIIK